MSEEKQYVSAIIYNIYLCIAYFVTPGEQFRRLKFGDRYFYTHTVSKYFHLIKRAWKIEIKITESIDM